MDIEGLGFDPFTATPSRVLDAAEARAPGPFQQSLLLMVDPGSLTAEEAVRYLDLHERVSAWWASLQTGALVAAAGPSAMMQEFLVLDRALASSNMPGAMSDAERVIRIADAAREEVAAALRWSPVTAQHRIDDARLLAGPLTATREAWELGEVSTAHVRVICQAAQRLSTYLPTVTDDGTDDGRAGASEQAAAAIAAFAAFADDCAGLQTRVLPIARRHGLSRTRRTAERAVEVIDAAGQAARRSRARCTRDVYLADTTDGQTTLIARLDTCTARSIMTAVDTAAGDARLTDPNTGTSTGTSTGAADSRSIGERRAEALAALVLGRQDAHADTPADARADDRPVVRLDVQLDVLIPLSMLADDAQPSFPDGALITLRDGSVVDLPDLARLLADPAVTAHARPVVVDHAGHVLDLGRRRYQVSDTLRRYLIARDGTCRFPGCRRAAAHCQIDHAVAWDDGGTTDTSNLGALCTRHHQLKTHAGWQIIQSDRTGRCTWLSPQGREYAHEPETLASIGHDPPPY